MHTVRRGQILTRETSIGLMLTFLGLWATHPQITQFAPRRPPRPLLRTVGPHCSWRCRRYLVRAKPPLPQGPPKTAPDLRCYRRSNDTERGLKRKATIAIGRNVRALVCENGASMQRPCASILMFLITDGLAGTFGELSHLRDAGVGD